MDKFGKLDDVNSDVFGSLEQGKFDPDDENVWLVGGSNCLILTGPWAEGGAADVTWDWFW